MVVDRSIPATVDPELATALDRWARRVFGAPRQLSAAITQVERHDEVLHRALTDVVRRELREERAPAAERRTSPPRIPLAQADPFVGTLETLQNDTLHTTVCGQCSSSGLMPCLACRGKTVVPCSTCDGAGNFRNPRTNRLNKCKTCKTSGFVGCMVCDVNGRVACQGCRGSGHQLAWLTYSETRLRRLGVHPTNSPLAAAQPRLHEPRALTPQELAAFSLEADTSAAGPLLLDGFGPEPRAVVQRELAGIDLRQERVVYQQYTRLAVVRRNVTYQMCGSSGTVEFSGPPLVGLYTQAATRPIRRRLVLWPVCLVLVGFGGALVAGSAMGASVYFAPSNRTVALLWLAASVLSIPWTGGILRAWRPVLRLRGIRPVEIIAGALWALLLLAIAIVGVASRPQAREVEQALAAGDTGRARVVVDALLEREGKSAAILELEDAVLMAEADAAEGEERLSKLDAVASRAGASASSASELARADRLATIREHVSAGRAHEAIAAIDRDFAATWTDDPEIAEERARAEELRAGECLDDPCRLIARRAARRAHETPARVEAVIHLREGLLGALATDRIPASLPPAQRIRAADDLAALAGRVIASELDDEDIAAAAAAAEAWVASERAAIPILGADLATLHAFFPELHASSNGVASVSLDGAEIFFNLDAKETCRGIYAVGHESHRELDAPFWSADRILAQAFGRPLKLVPAKSTSEASSTWKESKTVIVARWNGGVPVELRIGDAAP